MAQNDELLKIAMKRPTTDREWADFIIKLARLNLRSGLTGANDSTNSGYYIGQNEDGVQVVIIGDKSTGKYIEWDGTDLFLGPNVTQLP